MHRDPLPTPLPDDERNDEGGHWLAWLMLAAVIPLGAIVAALLSLAKRN